MVKLTAWPNKLGYSMRVKGGEWDLAQVAGYWHAAFTPTGECYSTKYGSGDTYKDAMLLAQSGEVCMRLAWR